MPAIASAIRGHPLIQSLRELKGNPRISVWTEIMFGLPYNLFAPFASVYMLAFGVTDPQIGALASLGLVVQIFAALVSGAIVDKFGRRLTLFVSDLLCWSVPCPRAGSHARTIWPTAGTTATS